MKASLQVRLSQHLALTPQLQQSIRLLQLSTLELHQEVEQMLETNPFLELEDDSPPPWEAALERARSAEVVRTGTEGDSDGGEAAGFGEGAEAGEALPEMSAGDFGTSAREDWENGTEADDFDGVRELPSLAAGSGASGDDDLEPREWRQAGPTLAEHLHEQLPGLRLAPADAAAVRLLIESLDDDGYLREPLQEIAARLLPPEEPSSPAGDDEPDANEELMSRLRCALSWLQQLDPTGVGARTLGECLQLQLRTRPDTPARALALTLCEHHLELLARRDVKKLMAATGADEAGLRAAQTLIVSCEPKPGRAFADAESLVIVPDVIVQRAGRGLKVTLNPDVMPKLRINDVYAAALRGPRGAASSPLGSRLQEARWFMKNILQRFDTILRVSQAIVERQRAFFTHGEIAMRPLVLREIADELGLHESTISRVTTAKYMTTPLGTFELKYFFGSALATEAGGNASSTAVRALIRQMVAAEDPRAPLSDSTLSQMLEEQGIQVARRTVAKYREALKIAPANLRKAL